MGAQFCNLPRAQVGLGTPLIVRPKYLERALKALVKHHAGYSDVKINITNYNCDITQIIQVERPKEHKAKDFDSWQTKRKRNFTYWILVGSFHQGSLEISKKFEECIDKHSITICVYAILYHLKKPT